MAINKDTLGNTSQRFGSHLMLVEEDQVLPNGLKKRISKVVHPGAVVIVPRTTSGNFLLLRQYRAVVGTYLFEFPAGTLELEEPPEVCAHRELAEEAGCEAKSWRKLGVIYPAPGFCTEQQHIFLAWDLSPKKLEGDLDEIIEVLEFSEAQIEKLIISGELNDGKSIAAFGMARLMGGL